MAQARPVHVTISPECSTVAEPLTTLLKDEHGAHGLRINKETCTGEPDLHIQPSGVKSGELGLVYQGTDQSIPQEDLEWAISQFVLSGLSLSAECQTSREDIDQIDFFMGDRPNVDADPSKWITDNPLMSDLTRRFPEYGNLVRFTCNERGLFLKAGNIPAERAYWNSTLNGGLPAFKKSDPIHEGTFMLHDIFHFVPVDPLLGETEPTEVQKSTYMTHRMLSEASTLVLADMVAISHADLEKTDYDVSKRKIYPVYQSIIKKTGATPGLEKLLAANAYFCFTGDATGFTNLGASAESIVDYQAKYEPIFKDDFMWNYQNISAMMDERSRNPRLKEYYTWLHRMTDTPQLDYYTDSLKSADGTTDIAKMVSQFRAEFIEASAYAKPLSEAKRLKKAQIKYLAGQRAVFARFGDVVNPDEQTEQFDDAFTELVQATDTSEMTCIGRKANNAVDTYIDMLALKGTLLPHETAIYKFSVPLYPIVFINYELPNAGDLRGAMQDFAAVNDRQLARVLETTEA